MTGPAKVAAWKEWLVSKEGKQCSAGSADGTYLENRLNAAFYAGIKAAEDQTKKMAAEWAQEFLAMTARLGNERP